MLKPRVSKLIIFLSAVIVLGFCKPAERKTTIWMIGDSTMCNYGPERAPLAGWGMPFVYFFDSSIAIENKARGGRSTRTFISEGRWKEVVNVVLPGDYVFMQFGHNDEAKEEKYKDRYTPVADYKANLLKFIAESKAKEALPVLITPVSRMRFDKAGKAQETHVDYTAAVIEVGLSTNVPVIDLDKKSRGLLQNLGPRDSKFLFMQLDSLVHPNYPVGQKDNTHFNDYGARRIAELVLEEIKVLLPGLARKIVKPSVKK